MTRQSQRGAVSRPVTRETVAGQDNGAQTGQRPDIGTKYNERGGITPTTYRNSPVRATWLVSLPSSWLD